jgi:hypothetical protein
MSEEASDERAASSKVGGAACARVRWAAISGTINVGGELTKVYPFLADSNLKDLVVMRHLQTEKPFMAPFGQVTKSWSDLTELVNKERNADGLRIFDPPVKIARLQRRFEEYMEFVKGSISGQPFRSGDDSEAPATEIQQGIEDIYEEWEGFRKENDSAKENSSNEKKKGKAMSEALRRAALGQWVPPKTGDAKDDVDALIDAGFDEMMMTPAPSRDAATVCLTGSERSSSSRTSDARNQIASLETLYKKHIESKMEYRSQKEANKKRKLALKEAQLEIEKERQEIEKERQAEERKDKEAQRTLLLALAHSLNSNRN